MKFVDEKKLLQRDLLCIIRGDHLYKGHIEEIFALYSQVIVFILTFNLVCVAQIIRLC